MVAPGVYLAAVTDDRGGIELDSAQGRTGMATVVLGSAVASLTATVVNVALPTLASDLGTGSSGQKWIINGYALTLAAFMLIGGSIGDRFGRLRTYRIGVMGERPVTAAEAAIKWVLSTGRARCRSLGAGFRERGSVSEPASSPDP